MTEDAQQWDAIVVGAGLGGLTTAAYLTTHGRRVLVLEAQRVLGGAAQTFHRRRVLDFNTGAHYVGDCTPGAPIPTVLRGMGLEGEVDLEPMDPDEFDRIVAPGFDFRVPRGWDAFEERLAATFPDEEAAVRSVVRTLRRMGEAMERLGAPPVPPVRTLLRHARSVAALADGPMSLQRLFDRHRLTPGARAAVGYISNFVLLPRERLAAAVYAYGLHHYIKNGGFRIGSGEVGTLARTVARLVRCHGGEIRMRTRVEEILVEAGRARGVRLSTGEIVTAPVVVSNADIATTYGTLVAPEHLASRRVRRYASAGLSGCGFSVYLGVDLDVREHLPRQNVFDIGGLDYAAMLHTMFRSSRDEFDADKAFLWITSAAMEGAGEGYSCLELTTLTPQDYAFWGLDGGALDGVDYHREPAYLDQKQRIEDALVRRTLERFPFLEGHIVWRESSTMLSHEDWTLNRYGPWAGLDFSLRNMALRPSARTEVAGLYLAGASTACGGAVLGTLRGGVETASAILGRPLWDEVSRGAVFGHGLTDKAFRTPPAPSAGAGEHLLEVVGLERHTPDSVVVELAVPDDLADTYSFRPGQYLTVRGDAAGEQVRRSYSICEPPGSGRLRIGVKRVEGGVFSGHALDELAAGDQLLVSAPTGAFGVPPSDGTPRTIAAITAGSGITPVLSVLSHVLATEPRTSCVLLYGNRTTASTMFRTELGELCARHPDRLRVEHHLSREARAELPGHHDGRLDAAALGRHLGDGVPPAEVDTWLLCGPSGLLATATAVLEEHGVTPDAIRSEAFDAAVGAATLPVHIAPDSVTEVQVTVGGETSRFSMRSAAETILDAAVRERDDLPFSCMSGSCGSCVARVDEGEVAMLDVPDSALGDGDREAGRTLLCLAHPTSDRVVVAVDVAT